MIRLTASAPEPHPLDRPKTDRERQPYVVPFTVVQDTREEIPWTFQGLHAFSDKKFRPLCIHVEERKLDTGDYSIAGYEHLVTVERKSLSDLYGTLSENLDQEKFGGKGRFRKEHERMAAMIDAGGYACVVIEAPLSMVETEWGETLANPPQGTLLHPRSVLGHQISWQQKYGVHWHWAGGRREAEILCFRILETFWRHQREAAAEARRAARKAQLAAQVALF